MRSLILLVPLLAAPASAQWIEPGTALHRLDGERAGDQFGYDSADAGDCDGDGVHDIVVGAPFEASAGPFAGRVYLYSGRSGEELFHVDGEPGALLGWSVNAAGDVNGDGHPDLVAGAPRGRSGPGFVLVLSGVDGTQLLRFEGASARDHFGDEVAGIGDLDGDGHDDVAVGAPGADGVARDCGAVSVYSGRTGAELVHLEGDVEGGRFGSSIDGRFRDGVALLAIGEPSAGPEGKGRVRVLRGRTLEPFFEIDADDTAGELGSHSVSIVGDVDGDGTPDVYASDWRNSAHGPMTGRAYVCSGATGARLLTLTGEHEGDGFGVGKARAGDVDGDGHDDLIIGSWLSCDAASKGGKVTLFSGKDGSVLRSWTGDSPWSIFGSAVTGLGDVDGDGTPDFLVSAAWESAHGKKAGRVWVLSGAQDAPAAGDVAGASAEPDLGDARRLLRGGDFHAAADVLAHLTASDPEDANAWFLLGFALHADGRYEEAIVADLRAAQFPEMAARASYNAACAHARLGNTDQAFDQLTRAMRAGFHDLRYVEGDQDLASLHDDPRWDALFPGANASGPFLEGDAAVLHVLDGEARGAQFGWALCDAGDCDGDGVHDLLVGSPFYGVDGGAAGRAYLYSGASGALLQRWQGERGDQLGFCVAAVGDVDGDGRPDCAIGAPGPSMGSGRVYVRSGRTGEELLVHDGDGRGARFGSVLAGIGDFDGDGCPDLAVGSTVRDEVGVGTGHVVLLSGKSGAVLASLDGPAPGDRFGSAVAGRFDQKQRVLLVGAPDGGPDRRGRIYVYRGTLDAPALVLEGDDEAVDYGRFAATLLGDVDGDGVGDFFTSDWEHRALGRATGRVWVRSGKDGSAILVLTGRRAGEGFGVGDGLAGDVDGDGVPDLVVGSWCDSTVAPRAGRVSLFSGRSGALLRTWTGTGRRNALGFDTCSLGDVDGDGVPDLAVSAVNQDASGERSGRVYVLSGAPAPRAVPVEASVVDKH